MIIVTHIGNKTGAVRKTPLMRVKDGNSYVLVGSQGGAPTDPVWVHNLRVNPNVEIRESFSSSPWMRGAPHRGFSLLIRRMSSRSSGSILGLPG